PSGRRQGGRDPCAGAPADAPSRALGAGCSRRERDPGRPRLRPDASDRGRSTLTRAALPKLRAYPVLAAAGLLAAVVLRRAAPAAGPPRAAPPGRGRSGVPRVALPSLPRARGGGPAGARRPPPPGGRAGRPGRGSRDRAPPPPPQRGRGGPPRALPGSPGAPR